MPKGGKTAGTELPEPWHGFLCELDASLPRPVELHCSGGFVAKFAYGLARPTSDIDYLAIIPPDQSSRVLQIAGQGSTLHKKYGLFLQQVAVATPPENYRSRLRKLFPGRFKKIRLLALDPYDLALSKLERNTPIDREDASYLAKAIPLDAELLRARYKKELRRYLGNPDREDLTLELWIEAFFPK